MGAAKRGGAFGAPDSNLLFRCREIFNGPIRGAKGSTADSSLSGLYITQGRWRPGYLPASALPTPTSPVGWGAAQLLFQGGGALGAFGPSGFIQYQIDPVTNCVGVRLTQSGAPPQTTLRTTATAGNCLCSFPLYQRLAPGAFPLMRPFWRYRYRVPARVLTPGGFFEVGIITNAGTASPNGLRASTSDWGFSLCCDAALYGGNWHVLSRLTNGGPLTVGPDLGLSSTVWRILEFRYSEGFTGQLEVVIDDVVRAVIPESQLPAVAGDQSSSFVPVICQTGATAGAGVTQGAWTGESEFELTEG